MPRRPTERLKRSVTHDNLWIYILKIMKDEGTVYPYELNPKIERRFGFRPGNVTAYIVLKKLQLDGYVKKAKATKSLGPRRTNFMITKKGAKELKVALPLLKKLVRNL